MSEKDDDIFDCIRLYYLINLKNKNKQIIICLRLYNSEFTDNFFVTPQAIFLLYDITSKDSFDCVIKYYKDLIKDNKYKNIKYILLGNKIDLINEEIEEKETKENNEEICNKDENKDEDNDENEKNQMEIEQIDEKNINIENEFKINKGQNKNINKNYYKEIIDKENFDLTKEISGLNGFYLEDLLNETALMLYKMVKKLENSTIEFSNLEGDSTIIENKLEINRGQNSYHDLDYKKDIKKINKSNNKPCCLICEIF